MGNLFNWKIFVAVSLSTVLLGINTANADTSEGAKEAGSNDADAKNLRVSEFVQLLSLMDKRLPARYVRYCGNNNWEKAGWNSEKDCLQDGRSHVVYRLTWKGAATEGFDKDDLEMLAQASRDGAEISVSEEAAPNSAGNRGGTNYKCARTHVSYSHGLHVVCSSHGFQWYANKHIDKKTGKRTGANRTEVQVWFRTDTNGIREYKQQYFEKIDSKTISSIASNDISKKVNRLANKIDKQYRITPYLATPGSVAYWVKNFSWHVRY